jgi:hypothetical protein
LYQGTTSVAPKTRLSLEKQSTRRSRANTEAPRFVSGRDLSRAENVPVFRRNNPRGLSRTNTEALPFVSGRDLSRAENVPFLRRNNPRGLSRADTEAPRFVSGRDLSRAENVSAFRRSNPRGEAAPTPRHCALYQGAT